MDEPRSLENVLDRSVRLLVDRITAAKTYLAVLRRRLRRGEVAPAEVEAHLRQVEQQLDEAAAATEEMKRAVEQTV
jgi:CII-binding regulator of phage lambda lysogenization HflD